MSAQGTQVPWLSKLTNGFRCIPTRERTVKVFVTTLLSTLLVAVLLVQSGSSPLAQAQQANTERPSVATVDTSSRPNMNRQEQGDPVVEKLEQSLKIALGVGYYETLGARMVDAGEFVPFVYNFTAPPEGELEKTFGVYGFHKYRLNGPVTYDPLGTNLINHKSVTNVGQIFEPEVPEDPSDNPNAVLCVFDEEGYTNYAAHMISYVLTPDQLRDFVQELQTRNQIDIGVPDDLFDKIGGLFYLNAVYTFWGGGRELAYFEVSVYGKDPETVYIAQGPLTLSMVPEGYYSFQPPADEKSTHGQRVVVIAVPGYETLSDYEKNKFIESLINSYRKITESEQRHQVHLPYVQND